MPRAPSDPVALGDGYRLVEPARPSQGPPGREFGRAAGSSLEFQEFRPYVPGDDLRHVDWRAYARTEVLTTRLYREEIASVLELVLDGSRSMQLTPAKERTTRAVAAFLARAAAASEFAVRGLVAGARPHPLDAAAFATAALPGVELSGTHSLMDCPLDGLLRPGTVRVVVSDFLFPHRAGELVSRLGARAGGLALVQVLDAGEIDPPQRGQLRLLESESPEHRDIPVDERTLDRYRRRLERLWSALQREARRVGGLALRLDAGLPFEELVRGPLTRSGLVEPR